MLSADILADVVRGVPVRPSPKTEQIETGKHIVGYDDVFKSLSL